MIKHPQWDREKRLDKIRDTARERGEMTGPGVRATGGPIPQRPGYYGEAVVRPPVWTWEIPVYFFIGALGGMAPTIACGALATHQLAVARAAMLLAGVAAIASPILLILDLGRPHLFINMLRVFKWRSTMSVGAWILTVFSPCAVCGWLALELHARQTFVGPVDAVIRVIAALLIFGAALCGLGLATYTGVVIAATAIPAWNLHYRLLPMHFGIAGLGSAAAAIELLGYQIRQLNALGFAVTILQTAFWIWLEFHRHGKADRAAHEGGSGWMIRGAELLIGPLALVLRSLGAVPFAAISFLLGAFLSRFGWLAAGRVSGRDPEAVFASQAS
jgi:hypothetical protein